MSDILKKIVSKKMERLELQKRELRLAELSAMAEDSPRSEKSLISALSHKDSSGIIAEFKRRSPSKGDLSNGLTPGVVARSYQEHGAAAMSILTEEDFFDGSTNDLIEARESSELPILRKDFIIDSYQLHESRLIGASAVLLIVAILEDHQLESFCRIATDLGLETLVEVHDEAEMRRALKHGFGLIGVNNRNLRTFDVSIETSLRIASMANEDTELVSESGLRDAETIDLLRDAGFKGFLVGEHFMRAESVASGFADLGVFK